MSVLNKLGNYTLTGILTAIFIKVVNSVIRKTCSKLELLKNRKMLLLGRLRFPYPFDTSEQYCFAAESKEDWVMIRQLKKYKFKMYCSEMS